MGLEANDLPMTKQISMPTAIWLWLELRFAFCLGWMLGSRMESSLGLGVEATPK